jgi:hypothetical protein
VGRLLTKSPAFAGLFLFPKLHAALGFRNMTRFTIRKVANKWMVWDTVTRSVAAVDEAPAIGLAEETAKRFADMLNSQNDLFSETKK